MRTKDEARAVTDVTNPQTLWAQNPTLKPTSTATNKASFVSSSNFLVGQQRFFSCVCVCVLRALAETLTTISS